MFDLGRSGFSLKSTMRPAGQMPPVRHAHAQGDRPGALAREAQGFGQLEGQQLVGGRRSRRRAGPRSGLGTAGHWCSKCRPAPNTSTHRTGPASLPAIETGDRRVTAEELLLAVEKLGAPLDTSPIRSCSGFASGSSRWIAARAGQVKPTSRRRGGPEDSRRNPTTAWAWLTDLRRRTTQATRSQSVSSVRFSDSWSRCLRAPKASRSMPVASSMTDH